MAAFTSETTCPTTGRYTTMRDSTLIGALELKIEAYRVDSRDRERHLQDAVALANLLDDAAPDPPLHGSAATRLRRFLRWVGDDRRLADAGIGRDEASDAAIAVEDLLGCEAGLDTEDSLGRA
ncbi:hypothetical protein [Micrococcus luteus]|uniref:hypothetical protein n=1 Tax=Micrococcus luteus TaxID=1270 RepID=UPI000E1C1E8D|nr:hypothetical protein [Micrococcus luteus]